MKFIRKLNAPDFFIDDTKNKTRWKNYRTKQKDNLKEYILNNEQYWLCCYCEKKLTLDGNSSHIEHIESRELNPNFIFSYQNLIVSCQGNSYNEAEDKTQHTCGHKKPNDFDEKLFLNPTCKHDISEYFIYDYQGLIESSDKDKEKSKYTITLLNLNGDNDLLAEARKISLFAFREAILKLKPPERGQAIKKILNNESWEYISFFRFRLSPKNIGLNLNKPSHVE